MLVIFFLFDSIAFAVSIYHLLFINCFYSHGTE